MNGNGGRVSRFVCKSFQNGALVQETLNKRSKNRPLFSLICCIHDSSFKRTKTDHLLTLMSFLTFARMFLWCFTQERKSNGFQKAWGQVNNDRIFFSFFQVDISLNWHCKYNKKSFIKVYVKVMFIFKSLAWSLETGLNSIGVLKGSKKLLDILFPEVHNQTRLEHVMTTIYVTMSCMC